ncbi:glucoside xylosyltransferase 1 [Biomphalaria glabrata]
MRKRMLFKIGVTLVLGIGIILFYLVNVQDIEKGETLKHDLFDETENLHRRGDAHVVNMDVADPDKRIKQIELTQRPVVIDDQLKSRLKIKPGPKSEDLKPKEMIKDQTSKPNTQSHEEVKLKNKSLKLEEIRVTKTSKTNAFVFKENHLQPVLQGQSHGETNGALVHLCVVVCGEREEETMAMLKSAAFVTPSTVSLAFHIVAEKSAQNFFQDQLELWPRRHRQRLSYFIYNISFPDDDTSDSWKKLFKPCASQRLFLPEILPSVDSLIYVDTDTLFLRSLADLWSHFYQMNESQLAGVVSEAEDGTAGWYNRFANHPFYGQYGVNSGVMLMNLTRMRKTSWLSDMQTFYNKYKMMIPWGDQDLINIYFAAHPDEVYLLSCPWNYRNDHCKYMSNCKAAEQEGVFVLHGSRRMFYQNKEPVFAAVFETLKNNELGNTVDRELVTKLERKLSEAKPSNCGKVSYIFLTQLKKMLHKSEDLPNLADEVDNEHLVEEIKADMIDDQKNSREDNNDQPSPLEHNQPRPLEHQVDQPVPQEHQDDQPRQQEHQDGQPRPQEHQDDLPNPLKHQDDQSNPLQHQDDLPNPLKHQDDQSNPLQHQDDQSNPLQHQDDQPRPQEHQDDQSNPLQHQDDQPGPLEYQGDKAKNGGFNNQVNAAKESKHSANLRQNIDQAISNYQNDAYDYYDNVLAKTDLPNNI